MKGYVMLINDLGMIIDVDASKRCLRLGKKPVYKDIIAPKTRTLRITLETIDSEDAMMNNLSKLKYAKDELIILRTPLANDVITSESIKVFMCILYKLCGTNIKAMWMLCHTRDYMFAGLLDAAGIASTTYFSDYFVL